MLVPIRLQIAGATLGMCLSFVFENTLANHVLVARFETKDLKSEVLENAPKAWLQLREKYFNNRAWKTSNKTINRRSNSAVPSEFFMKSTVYSAAPLFCEEKEVSTAEKIISTQVVGGNSQYAFSLSREPGLAWRLLGTEILEERIAGFQPADLQMNRPREKEPARSIRIVFSRGEILNISGQPVEAFFNNVKDSITNVVEKNDPNLGRMVIVEFDDTSEAKSRASSSVKSRRVFGSITFLPEKLWSLHGCALNYESLGQDGEVLTNSTSEMDFVYLSGSNFPQSVKLKSILSSGMETESIVEIEQLTRQEISEAREKCYLSGFGLPEPSGINWGWPRWVYFALALGCIGLFGTVFIYLRRRGNSK